MERQVTSETSAPKQKRIESANAAADSDSDVAFWAEDTSESEDGMPDLEAVSDSEDDESAFGDSEGGEGEGDWFSDVDEDSDSPWGCGWDTEELSGASGSDVDSLAGVDSDSVGARTMDGEEVFEAAASEEAFSISNSKADADKGHTEVYDSGCTKHITPYCEELSNFIEIPPKVFCAANKENFSATGMGDMTIDVPNGVSDASQLQLTEVLYSPEVGYTLVSVGKLDDHGFSATFAGGKCTIHNPDGELVGEVPKVGKGLYRVNHEPESANAVEEKITLMQFHRRMGHISPDLA